MFRWVVLCLIWVLLTAPVRAQVGDDESNQTIAEIPFKQTEAIAGETYWRVGAVLILMLILAALVALLLKKFVLGKRLPHFADTRIQIIEAKRISPRILLYLINVDGVEYLLSHSGDSNSLLRHDQPVEDRGSQQ